MATGVVLPWQETGCPHRADALAWVLDWWQRNHPDWPVTLAPCPPGPWSKAKAVTPAVEALTADVVIVADADVWSDGVAEAVARVEAGHGWAIPHRKVHRLNEDSTQAVYGGHEPSRLPLAEPAYVGVAGGGIVVLPRSTYLSAPLDPRFVGWGGEDIAWSHALGCLLGGPWRGRVSLWHLWHPPQDRTTRKHGSAASEALKARYEAARRSPDLMRSLLEEARWQTSASSSTARASVPSSAVPRSRPT